MLSGKIVRAGFDATRRAETDLGGMAFGLVSEKERYSDPFHSRP
jgi:hypothetical protein